MIGRHGVRTIAFRARGRVPGSRPMRAVSRGIMNICVVALGKIGLPLAVQFARSGHRVVGADISAATVDLVNQGLEPFPNEADLDRFLAEVIEEGTLVATTDVTAAVQGSEVVVVVVPLIVDRDKQPDFGALDHATSAIGAG